MIDRCKFVHNLPCEQVSDRITEFEEENAKLRKLARGLNWCTENAKVPSAECERCPLGDTFFECGELSCEKLIRELGIEVEDEDEG